MVSVLTTASSIGGFVAQTHQIGQKFGNSPTLFLRAKSATAFSVS